MPVNRNGFRDLKEGAVLLQSKLARIDNTLLCHVVSRKDSTLDFTPPPGVEMDAASRFGRSSVDSRSGVSLCPTFSGRCYPRSW